MKREEAISMLSECFVPVTREEWEAVTKVDVWSELLMFFSTAIDPSPRWDVVFERLAAPPTYEEKTQFAARFFTGGLPDSALPVESLYVQIGTGVATREYLREPALYMRDLVKALGLEVPVAFTACPDHLSVELDVAAFLQATCPEDAHDFVTSRFDWLLNYAVRLESINTDASFYVAVIKVLIYVIDAWRKEE